MRVVVFQHLACEHPGIWREFLREDGADVLTVELDHAASVEIVRLDDNLERSVLGIRLDRRLDRHPRRRHGY